MSAHGIGPRRYLATCKDPYDGSATRCYRRVIYGTEYAFNVTRWPDGYVRIEACAPGIAGSGHLFSGYPKRKARR